MGRSHIYSDRTSTSSSTPTGTEADTRPLAVDAHGGWPALLGAVTDGRDLSEAEASAAMSDILAGLATPAQIAGLVVGLRAKGESVSELTGFATAMVAAAEPLKVGPEAIDIVGTGGSRHRRTHALNVSTMASIVASAGGALICKHGNRRASSTSGSFDFLEALGVAIDLTPTQLETCLARVGLGFAFARTFHPAMRFAGPVRAELGIPTVFNLLGPLANPGRVTRQLVGVSSPERGRAMAEVFRAIGSESAWIVSGADGLDELSTAGESVVFKVTSTGVVEERLSPADAGLAAVSLDDLTGGSAEVNAAIFERILGGEAGPYREIVVLNAAAGLVVAGVAPTLPRGLELAADAIDGGAAGEKLAELRAVTNELVAQSGEE